MMLGVEVVAEATRLPGSPTRGLDSGALDRSRVAGLPYALLWGPVHGGTQRRPSIIEPSTQRRAAGGPFERVRSARGPAFERRDAARGMGL